MLTKSVSRRSNPPCRNIRSRAVWSPVTRTCHRQLPLRCRISKCRSPTSRLSLDLHSNSAHRSCVCLPLTKRTIMLPQQSGRTLSQPCKKCVTGLLLMRSRSPFRITMTSPYTQMLSSNYLQTSTVTTVGSDSMHGHPLCVARTSTSPPGRQPPHTVITTNADYVRFPRYRYHPAAVNYTRETPDQVRAVPFGEGFIDYESLFHRPPRRRLQRHRQLRNVLPPSVVAARCTTSTGTPAPISNGCVKTSCPRDRTS